MSQDTTTKALLMTHIVRMHILPFLIRFLILHAAPQDLDSEGDVYGQRYAPSAESLGPRMHSDIASTPTIADYSGGARDSYPAWSSDRQIPLSKEEIEDIFLDLTQKFGFQRDSMRNMVSRETSSSYAEVDPLF